MTPRRCQSEAAGAVLTAIRSGRGGLVRMPTRSGKSIAMGLVLRRLHERAELPRTIVVTSRTMLVDDLVHTFWRLLDPAARSFSPADLDRETKVVRKARAQSEIVGRWDGHVQRPGLVTVTTYPSLSDLDPAPLLFCDEAHRTKGMALRALVERTPIRIGWTATPHGRDGSDRLPFERLLYELTYADAVAQGVVVPWVPVQPEHVPERRDESLYDPARVLGVALDLIAARGGPEAIGPVLFTAPNLTVAAWMAEQIRTRGWSSEAANPAQGRRAIRSLIRAFGAGEPQTLVTVDLLAEGVTIPSLRALALCAAPRGRNHLCQVAGRVMGTCAPDRWGEKTEALLFDPACILASYRLEHPAALGEARSVPRSVRAVARASIAALVALPWAQAVEPLSVWSMALLRLAEGYARHPAPGRRPGMAERSLPASERERAALLRLLPLLRWVAGPRTGEGREKVGEAHREAIRRVAEQDGAIPCGVVLDLIGVLRLVAEVSERAVRASRAPGLAAGARVGVRAQGYLRVPAGLALPAAGAPLAASSAADVVEGA